jgi:hypothetical protein
VTNAAKLVAKKPGLDVSTVAQLRDLASALVRLCDNGKPVAPVTVNAENAQVLICDERRRTELIQQRERLLALEADSERKIETALPVTPSQARNASNVDVGAGNGIVAQNQSPVAQKDPYLSVMESIGTAASWRAGKGSEPQNLAGSFGPYPEEYE